MPGETTVYKIKFALAGDEVKAFPAAVSEPGAKTIDEALSHTGVSYTAAKNFTKLESEAGVEVSATRPALVTIESLTKALSNVLVGGVLVGELEVEKTSITVLVPPGQKWKTNLATFTSSILL